MRTLGLTRFDAVTPGLIERATQEHELDTARRPLPIAADIEAGDTAGLFFNFMDSEDSQWFEASPAERRAGFGNGRYSNNVMHPSNRSHTPIRIDCLTAAPQPLAAITSGGVFVYPRNNL
ncbi:hypothetical protein [Cupriavidus sp. CuC1]|uniref:hypothetical protein n=1 Tax=Cupriavidus sp. CuC1 TaxID=3373131 RepID=UPI0037D35131